MKTSLYTLFIVALSFLSIKAVIPKEYPPKSVKEEQTEIKFKKLKLDNLIAKMNHDLEVDSIALASLKQHKNGK